VSIEGEKERALIDQVMARVAHESDAIEDPPANELSGDDHCIQRKGEIKPGTEMFVGGEGSHYI
jgi:hypothetical protein